MVESDEPITLLRCENPSCMKVSCYLCKKDANLYHDDRVWFNVFIDVVIIKYMHMFIKFIEWY
jgi:hypothetical protein